MANYCKGCRFFNDEGRCEARNIQPSAQSTACYSYAAYSSRNPGDLKYCKGCRFFSAPWTCVERNAGTGPTDPKCVYGSIVK